MISDIAYYSSRGGRMANQDAVKVVKSPDCILMIVADGMGGKAGGELASREAVMSVERSLAGQPVSADNLYDAVAAANQDVIACTKDLSPRTTLAVLWADREQALAATVGDTRIYQFRSGGIRFQSVDHTVAQMSVLAGEMEPDKLRASDERFRLLQALGSEDGVRAEMNSLDVEEGDAFLICTDGFWEYVLEQDMIKELEQAENTRQWLESMKARVRENQPQRGDNHSAVAVMIG